MKLIVISADSDAGDNPGDAGDGADDDGDVDPDVVSVIYSEAKSVARYPSETVTSLPEYRNEDPVFWDTRWIYPVSIYSPTPL